MKLAAVILLLQCAMLVVLANQGDTRDIDLGIDDNNELERKFKKKRKKHPFYYNNNNNNNFNPCGYGRSFFGFGKFGQPSVTYISAPVTNFYGYGGYGGYGGDGDCGQQQYNQGGGGHFGSHGLFGLHGLFANKFGSNNQGNNQFRPYNQFGNGYNQFGSYQGYNGQYYNKRPFQFVSNFGSAIADIFNRPKKKLQFFRPFNRFLTSSESDYDDDN